MAVDHITQESAHDLLSRLVATLTTSPKGLERYTELFDNDLDLENPAHGLMAVRDLLFSCMREQVFELFRSAHGHMPRHEAIRWHSGEDHIADGDRGVYLHMLYGQDEKWRFYVGQSSNLRETIHQKTQHPDPSEIKLAPSLHQYAAAQSKWDAFLVLAVLPTSLPLGFHQTEEKKTLVINVLEMWCALLFHTLQQKDMQRWHMYRRYGHSGTDGQRPWHGLNIASPLAQGREGRKVDDHQGAQDDSEILATSDDPLAKAYAEALATPSETKVEQPLPEPPVKLAISPTPAPLPAPRGPRADELVAARRSGMVIGAAIGFGVSLLLFSCLGMREGRRW